MTTLRKNNKNNKILLSCVDAGAANYLIPLIKKNDLLFCVYASGVAAKLLEDAGVAYDFVDEANWNTLKNKSYLILNEIKPSLLLCGTSWGNTLDKALTCEAKSLGIRTVSVIDHWTIFRYRYCDVTTKECDSEMKFLTDHVIVIDNVARERAINDGLCSDKIFIGGQPYLETLEEKASTFCASDISKTQPMTLLFVSEEIRDDLGKVENISYDEHEVLKDLLRLSQRLGMRLDVKLHPMEKSGKFDYLFTGSHATTRVFTEMSFENMLYSYQFIVGMDSMLLIELGLYRKNILSYRPHSHIESYCASVKSPTREFSDLSSMEQFIANQMSLESMPLDLYRRSEPYFYGSVQRVMDIIDEIGTTI